MQVKNNLNRKCVISIKSMANNNTRRAPVKEKHCNRTLCLQQMNRFYQKLNNIDNIKWL